MKIAEVTSMVKTVKPLTPEKARVQAMKQSIAKQKEALARERERQHDAKHAQKMQALHQNSLGL